MVSTILFLLLVTCASSVLSLGETNRNLDELLVKNFKVDRHENYALVRFESNSGELFVYNLSKVESVYHGKANILVLNGSSTRSILPGSSTYVYRPVNGNSATVTFSDDGSVRGLFIQDGVMYSLSPDRREMSSSAAPLSKKHVLTPETWINEHAGCQTVNHHSNGLNSKPRNLKNSKPKPRNLELKQWRNCYTRQSVPRYFDIALASDYSFYLAEAESMENVIKELESYIAHTNLVFSAQFNIYLRISQLVITPFKTAETASVFKECKSSIRDTLEEFRTWVKGLPRPSSDNSVEKELLTPVKSGVWHLATDCFPPPGTVGIAFVNDDIDNRPGTLCEIDGSNTGISSKGRQSWLTFAHEIGHNFGMRHSFEDGQGTTGGIMDYGDGMFEGEIQFIEDYRKDEICAELDYALSHFDCLNHVSEFHPDCSNILSTDPCFAGGTCFEGECRTNAVVLQVGNSLVDFREAVFNLPPVKSQTTISGTLSKSFSEDLCTEPEPNSQSGRFLLTSMYGDCTYLTKALNAQLAGAVGLLVSSLEPNEQHPDNLITMGIEDDSGVITSPSIPSLFISNRNALHLLESLSVPQTVQYGYLSGIGNEFPVIVSPQDTEVIGDNDNQGDEITTTTTTVKKSIPKELIWGFVVLAVFGVVAILFFLKKMIFSSENKNQDQNHDNHDARSKSFASFVSVHETL